ncbi:unnamed protein product [Acanthoscelides obtectus]|uniref:Uncharacterized protein n=1 Tax=Acanthoscelides obtectus TaxID=200917 RepID=A0A9P0LET3_ACAOB|nr:unnamed protein product [Acanthoscelides obtectus]CAK1656839.1 hypothetical protein AOBTE_LOCUS19950 [Acanthoscelides obtectus]
MKFLHIFILILIMTITWTYCQDEEPQTCTSAEDCIECAEKHCHCIEGLCLEPRIDYY